MDPRLRRTRANLRTAILDLASRRPVGTLTVAEVSRAAGITRDTFYRHAAGPEELLVAALGDDLVEVELPPAGGAEDFRAAVQLLVEHVARHSAVYHAALVDGDDGPVRTVLHAQVARRLDTYLRRNPAAVPDVPDGLPADAARDVLVAQGAAGTVGAITAWLRAGAPQEQIPALARTIMVGGPRWRYPDGS